MSFIKVKEAISKSALNKFNLNFPHLTTQGFGMMVPTLCVESVPRDKFTISYSYQSLLAPLSTPAFADIKNVTRFFFVPMESIFSHFKDMYSDSTDPSLSNLLSVPQISNAQIYNFFTTQQGLVTRLVSDPNIYYRMFEGNKVLTDNLGRVIVVAGAQVAAWDNLYYWYMYIDSAGVLQIRPYSDSSAPPLHPVQDPLVSSELVSWGYTESLKDLSNPNVPKEYKFFYAYNGALQTPFQQGQIFVATGASLVRGDYTEVSLFADTQLKAFYGSRGASYAYMNGNYTIFSSTPMTDYAAVLPADFLQFEYVAQGSHAYDFVDSDTGDMYKFTYKGRYLYKVFLGLGYEISFTASDTTSMSLLPLLAYLRVWYDFIYPSAYVESLGIASLFHDPSSWNVNQILTKLLSVLFVPYKQDYFTAAWKDFMRVGNKTYSIPRLNAFEPTSDFQVIDKSNASGVPFIDSVQASRTANLTEYGLKVLQGVTDWLVRNNVSGSRFFEQMCTRFGVRGYDVDPTRSMYVDSCVSKIQIGQQMATTETESQLLGERAGIGWSDDKGNIHFENRVDQFGFLISLSCIMPDVDYYQGRNRQLQHLDMFSFFTPEFERTFMQAIRNDELFACFHSKDEFIAGSSYGGTPNGKFGLAPRYSEYKHGFAKISGDFRCMSRNLGLDAYHAMREIPTPSVATPLALGIDFMKVDDQYARLFAQLHDMYDEPIDHFVSMFQFRIEAFRPMQSIGEQLLIEEGGELVKVENQGTQL